MSKEYFKTIIANTRAAAEQWDKFAAECGDIEAFKKAFHLRPTSDKVTIVSTLQSRPMRGTSVKDYEIVQFLKDLYDRDLYEEGFEDKTINEKIAALTEKGFKEGNSSESHEFRVQARMINLMESNSALKSFLRVDKLNFIASEFILHPKSDQEKGLDGLKVDIVGYDGHGKVFFFELKTPENINDKNLVQIKNYLHKYGIEKKDHTIAVLSNYPINSIKTSDVEFHGYLVYGYSDNLDTTKSKPFHSPDKPGEIHFR